MIMAEIRELTGPFDAWARGAMPGSKIIYHTGEYAGGASTPAGLCAGRPWTQPMLVWYCW